MAVPISNVTRRQVYSPSGTGGAGPYSFTFEILANTDIAVYKDDTLLTLTTHYTVTINSNGTGSVTITAAGLALSPTSPTQYAIVGNRTIQRTTDFTTGGDFFANAINDELDQQTIFAQQNAEGLARALTAPQTDPTSINMTLPSKASRANKTLSFDANGDPTPGVSAADVANATTYATNAANSATAAASSASSASSSASSASSSASTASTQASNASTSATNASNSASSASTSATNAASSASTAATQASNASTSATNAASSASAASTSASNAATSATNASNSASTATTQASNAATSASSASGSATSAANSAAAAASALDSFDDRYLGTKSSDPTLDNDGNALAAGALYFSTSQNVMKVYDGASWITATSAGATSLLQFKYVATAGQTSFSGAATVGGTLTYTVNNIVVFLNGVALDSTDYTASTGTSVVLGTAAALNDELVIIAFKSFTVADTYTKGEVDGFAVKLTGNQTVAGTKTFSSDSVINGLTVGRGGAGGAANTAYGASAIPIAPNSGVTAIGSNAGKLFNTASDTGQSTFVGYFAGAQVSTGTDSTFVGGSAGTNTTTGAKNTAVGSQALQLNTTASYNTAVGYQAGYTNTTNSYNVFLGYQAGYTSNYNGNGFNTCVGVQVGYSLTTGRGNTFIGGASTSSGYYVTSGNNNTILGGYTGNQGGLDIRTSSNNIVLSDGDGNPRLILDNNGDLRVPQAYTSTTAGAANLNVGTTGYIVRSTSALKYKQDIRDIENIDISQFRPVRYKSKCEGDDQTKDHFGIVADEVDAAGIKELVSYGAEGEVEGFQYERLTVVLVKAIQELKAEVDSLKAQINGASA